MCRVTKIEDIKAFLRTFEDEKYKPWRISFLNLLFRNKFTTYDEHMELLQEVDVWLKG